MSTSVAQKTFMGIAGAMAGFYLVVGVLVSLGMGNPGDIPRFLWAVIGLCPGAIILVGFWTDRRSPLLGSILVMVGAIPLAVIFWWSLFLPLFAGSLVILGVGRAIGSASGRKALP